MDGTAKRRGKGIGPERALTVMEVAVPLFSSRLNDYRILQMTIEHDLHQFISSQVVPDGTVTETEPLISSGKVDSLGLLQILGFIEQSYGVTLLASGSPKDFENIQTLANAIRRAQDNSR